MSGFPSVARLGGRVEAVELGRLLSAPTSVAVVGASVTAASRSGRPLDYLGRFGYAGQIHVVHPRETTVLGHPAVPSIPDLPDSIDVAMINTAAATVPSALRELDKRGVRLAISIASGFEDPDLPIRQELLEALADTEIRLIGPNCTGLMAPATRSFLTTSSFLQHFTPRPGGVALVSQSGGMGNGLLTSVFKRGAGVSHLVTTGDELDIGCLEVIAGLLTRTEVKAVGVLIEGITDADWLETVADLIQSTGKPVYFLRMARTDAGRLAAGAHTGRVVGPADVASAVLGGAGLREVHDLEQLGDVLVCSDLFTRPAGGRIGVVSCSGASAGLAADQIGMSGTLTMPAPSATTRASAARELAADDFANPLDVPGHDTPRMAHALRTVRALPDFDSVVGVVSSLAHDPDQLVEGLRGASAEPSLPLVLTFLSPEDSFPPATIDALASLGIAALPTPQRAITALELLTRRTDAGPATTDEDAPPTNIVGIEAILGADAGLRLPYARWEIVDGPDAAERAGDALGFPVVVKVAGRSLHHRSDVGGVAVGVTRDELAAAFARIRDVAHRHGDVVMVQQQAASGFELLISILRSPEFGPVAIVRPGGVLAELMDAQVILPGRWTPQRRLEALRRSRLGVILQGYRGGRTYDVPAVADLATAALDVLTGGGFEFIEFNPVIVGERGVSVVDAIGAPAQQPAGTVSDLLDCHTD